VESLIVECLDERSLLFVLAMAAEVSWGTRAGLLADDFLRGSASGWLGTGVWIEPEVSVSG